MRTYWGKLMGTAGGWFLFDITFYGNSLFQPTVLHEARGRHAPPTPPPPHHQHAPPHTPLGAPPRPHPPPVPPRPAALWATLTLTAASSTTTATALP